MESVLRQAFAAQAARVGASVHAAPRSGWPTLALELLRAAGSRTAALAMTLQRRAELVDLLTEAGLELTPLERLTPLDRADVGLSAARLGVAETGSVLLHSSSLDRRVELCVDQHLVLLDAEALVPTLDDALAVVRQLSAGGGAYASLVSGPSRSADIERQLTIGVHGPRALHLLLLEPER